MGSLIGNLKLAKLEAYWTAESRKLEEKYNFHIFDPSYLKESEALFNKRMDEEATTTGLEGKTLYYLQQIGQLAFDMGLAPIQILPFVDYKTMQAVPDNFNFLQLGVKLRKMYKALDQPTEQMMETMFGPGISGISQVPTLKGEIRMLIEFLDQHGEIYVVAN